MSVLSGKERRTLREVCEALLPGPLDPIFNLVEHTIVALPRDQIRELGLLLRALQVPFFVAVLIGRFLGFSALDSAGREAVLLALARSRIPRLRKGFQGLKRLACFYYYAAPDANIVAEIGYTPSPRLPARAPMVPLIAVPQSGSIDCDACVIGSGAGGGVIAAELAAAGLRVIVLEAGPGLQADGFDQQELHGMQSLYLQQGRLSTQDLAVAIVAGSALGGGTAVNWQTSFRPPDQVRSEWARSSGCSFFTEPAFDASLDQVCERLQVGTQESQVNRNNDALRRGCERLGYRWNVIPRNASGCDPAQCGYCAYGCRVGGKQSTTVTYLRDAVATGNCSIITGCWAQRINTASGKVIGVSAVCDNVFLSVRAPMVVCASGGVETPALLLRSGLRLPAVGRHLYLHPTTCVAGFYPARIEPWSGPPQTIVCDHFADLADGYGARLETAPVHPGLFALALPWHGARAHHELMEQIAHAAAFIVLTRDHTGGQVWVNTEGRTLIDYRVGERETGYLNTGMAAAARIHEAAGAERIVTLHSKRVEWRRGEDIDAFTASLARHTFADNWSPIFSAHQMGTCRMGSHADAAVCAANGAVFGVDGLYIGDASALPGSCGVNPMITIMAVAHHTAQRIMEA